jgi:hypothetical protein
MNEEFLQYIWKTRMGKKTVTTMAGDKIVIMNPGEQNRDAGPDFINAMVRMGDTTWAGSVEIHVRSSDWNRHGHDRDLAYDNVVLHAVYEYDGPVARSSGEEIPAITLKEHIPKKAYNAYLDFLNNHLWVPCANEIGKVPPQISGKLLEELCLARINRRSDQIRQLVLENKGDWNQAFYESLAGTLGARLNKEPFEMLARQTPLQIILKNRGNLGTLEALLFGQAGFLDQQFKEDYPMNLSVEYQHIKNKYGLEGIPAYLWKFLRLRPGNFPTIRIAQLAALYYREPLLLGTLVDEEDAGKWKERFRISVSDYWKTHYHFDALSARSEKNMGDETVELILINTAVPFLYTFGTLHGNKKISERAVSCLSEMPAETNSIIRTFRYFGLECVSAVHSQGALELKKYWCDSRRCLECSLGQELLKIAIEVCD